MSLSQAHQPQYSNVGTDTITTCYMWSQIEPTMAIVGACLTTMRPLVAGVDLSFFSPINWTSRITASCSSAKSGGRCSHGSDGSKRTQETPGKSMRWVFEDRKSDIKLLGFEHLEGAGTQETIVFVERAEGEIMMLEDGTPSLSSVERGRCMV